MDRKNFLKDSAMLAAGSFLVPHFNIISSRGPKSEIIGHGDFRYKVDKTWGLLDPAVHPVKDCHEMVMDSRKRLIMLTNETRNNIIIYDKSGKLLDTWGHEFPGGHGLTLHNENGTEYLYITDYDLESVFKLSMDGKILLTIKHPKFIGEYAECDRFRPTETCIGPNGDIYVADGYGSQYILQYTAKGEFIRKFGGDGYRDDKFKQVHGIVVDNRDKTNPVLLCTDRMKNRFNRWTLNGKYIDSVYLPGIYMSRPVIDDDMVYSGVCWSALKHHMLTYNSGFVTIMDKNNCVVSNPGGTRPVYKHGEAGLMVQDKPIFQHCHDVCVDDDKNLYVCQWQAGSTYPVRLVRV